MSNTIVKEVSGSLIFAQITFLDKGVLVSLTGGQCSHIGSVSMASCGHLVNSVAYPGHYEQQVSDTWAISLSERLRTDVTVACGIHYDNADTELIQEILCACNELLDRIA